MERNDLTDEQRHAVGTTDANYPLIAGAGTGKTTTLSFRYVELLAANPELRPREILVTTFTRRAAEELVDAIRGRVLDRIATTDPDDEVDVVRWRRVLDELDDAYVHTLHAFCQRVLQEHALDAPGVQAGFELVDDVDGSELTTEIVDDLVAERSADVETILDANVTSEQGLANVLDDLFSKRPASRRWADHWSDPARTVDEYVDHVEASFHPLSDDEATAILAEDDLAPAVDELRDFLADAPTDDPGTKVGRIRDLVDRIDGAGGLEGPTTTAERRRLIAEISDVLTKGNGETYASYTPKKGGWQASEEDREAIGELVETVADAIEAVRWQAALGDVDLADDRRSAPYVFALARLFETAVERYQSRKRERNLVDYTDLVQQTRMLLTDDARADVRETLCEQFEYVMIDEVQDTDPSQWAIVGELTRVDAADVRYGGENVFVVGDEKQSIFRFRGADVAVFEDSRGELVAANADALSTLVDDDLDVRVRVGDRPGFELAQNFRTLPPVLEFVNGVFEGVFDDGADRAPYQAPPQALAPARDDPVDVGGIAEYLLVPDEELAGALLADTHPIRTEPAYHTRSNEARAVAARITTLVDDETPVYADEADRDGADESTVGDGADSPAATPSNRTRPVSFDDVAVIVRKRTHLQAFKHEFEAAEIPYTVVKGDGFFETPEVRTLLNLLRAIVDPSRAIALYGVLRSPMFGLADDDLAPYAECDDVWETLQDATEDSIQRAVAVLGDARRRAGCAEGPASVDSWSTLLEDVLDRTGYLASVSADARPRQGVANADRFLELVAEHDDLPSLDAVLERLEAEREHADYNPEAAIPEGSPGVQIMTVHAAKGDEFPVVIVPGINDAYNAQSPINNSLEFEVVDDTPELGLMIPDPEDPFETTTTVAREGIRDARMERLRAEEKRVLYVACTRARDHLVLAGTHDGEVTDEGILELDEGDPEAASSWGDLLQPLLLDGDLSALVGNETATISRELAAEYHRDDADHLPRYKIRLPPRPASIDAEPSQEPGPVQADLGVPSTAPPSYRLAPSQLADLESDRPDGRLSYDVSRNVIAYENDDEDGTESNSASDVESAGDDERTLYGTVFGETVHRICELDRTRGEWDAVIDDTLVAKSVDRDVTARDRETVSEHAERALAYVDDQTTATTRRHDELELTATLSGGELYGFVDCLLVDGDDYHVVDYKTGDHDPEDVPGKTAYYQPQLDAYAAMLSATATDVDSITTTLYYTALDRADSRTYDGGIDLEAFEARVEALLASVDVDDEN